MRDELRIENITSENLEKMSNAELIDMRGRCLNIFDRYFAKSDVQKAVGMDRRRFLTKYLLLRSEMDSRSIKLFRERPLDVEVHNRIFKASIWKLDVPAMGDMIAIPNYVSICGEFVQSPVSAEKIDVVIRTAKEHRNEAFEEKISTLIKEQTNKELNIVYEPKGPGRAFIPLFDLVLKSHDETRKVKKLTPAQRIECDAETARIKENKKLPLAEEPHEFKAAKFTHPNGHPRCLTCGDEESIGKVCNMPDAWYEKHKWDDEEAWTEERKKLKASGKLKKTFAIKKPEESETTIRIPVGSDCEVTATITIDKGQGIQALYCGKIKKVRTFLFDKRVKAWTMASARAWIKEQKEKVNKNLLEENLETFEYLIHHVEIKGDEEIIHHCHMYDHIGNLFEQAHLWIEKGKAYLDGKQIKDGHYHVIKGLEPTQEIAWSEEEATDAGIKPKGMMSGMTLKEKAKEW